VGRSLVGCFLGILSKESAGFFVASESFGIFIVDDAGTGFVRFSSLLVGFGFFTGIELGIGFVDDELILLVLIIRASTDDDDFATPIRSLLIVDV